MAARRGMASRLSVLQYVRSLSIECAAVLLCRDVLNTIQHQIYCMLAEAP